MRSTEQLARWVADMDFAALPAGAAACTKGLLYKTVVAMRLGAREPIGRTVLEFTERSGGAPEASVIGGLRVPVEAAAFANGVLAHATESEDVLFLPNREAIATCWIFPALLALGEQSGASGRQVLTASAVAFEVAARMARAGPGLGVQCGLNTATWFGTPAVAAGAAHLLGLDAAGVENAMSLAASQSSGLAGQIGTDAHTIEAGHCGRAGLFAARLAAAGARGAPGLLDDGGTLYAPLRGGPVERAWLTRGLGSPPFAVEQVELKKYPGCGFLHASVDALRELVVEHRLTAKDVLAVETRVHPLAARVCDRPEPKTPAAARFSFQYALAEVLLRGRIDYDSFRDPGRLDDPLGLALQRRIRVVADPQLSESDAGAHLQVTVRSGPPLVRHTRAFKGDPLDPLTREELRALLRPLLDAEIGEERAGQVEAAMLRLEEQPDLRELVDCFSRGAGPCGRSLSAVVPALAGRERAGSGRCARKSR